MRIISGKHGGRKLKEFSGNDVRPTSDRAKEALFNILGNISGLSFLDLFAGTGAVGIEALSRGAFPVTLVDSSAESVKIEKDNLTAIGETATVVKSDAYDFLNKSAGVYDIIFLDPPYKENAFAALEIVAKRNLLKKGGLLIYEHSGEGLTPPVGLKQHDSRKYGVAKFDFYTAGD